MTEPTNDPAPEPADGPTTEAACTAAIDLVDVRCSAHHHPHRGAHVSTGRTLLGDRWSLFWWTPDSTPADDQLDADAAAHPAQLPDLTAEQVQLATPTALPRRLRRRRADRALVQP